MLILALEVKLNVCAWIDLGYLLARLTSELFDDGLDVVQPNLWGSNTKEGCEGADDII